MMALNKPNGQSEPVKNDLNILGLKTDLPPQENAMAPPTTKLDEIRRELLQSHMAMQLSITQLTEVLIAREKTTSNSWKSPGGIWTIICMALIVLGVAGEFIRLESKVNGQDLAKMQETLTRMDQREQDEDLAHRVTTLEKMQSYAAGLAQHDLSNDSGKKERH